MPLPAPVEREVLHSRSIEVVGYRRRDQLWDIEARLIDSKANAPASPRCGEGLSGEPVHDMSLRLTVDRYFTIRALEVTSDKHPYPVCSKALGAFGLLVGLTVEPGWRRKVKEHVDQSAGCTHLTELLGVSGSVVFQTILPNLYDREAFEKRPRPGLINSCRAFRRDSELVRQLWPSLPPE